MQDELERRLQDALADVTRAAKLSRHGERLPWCFFFYRFDEIFEGKQSQQSCWLILHENSTCNRENYPGMLWANGSVMGGSDSAGAAADRRGRGGGSHRATRLSNVSLPPTRPLTLPFSPLLLYTLH